MIPPYRSYSSQLATMRLSTVSTSSATSTRSTASAASSTTSSSAPSSPKTVHFGPVEHIETETEPQEPVSAWDDDSDDEEPSFIFRHLKHKPAFRLDRFARRQTNSHASMMSKDDSYIMRTSGEEVRVVPQSEARSPPLSPDHRKLQQEIEQQYQNEHFLKAFSLTPTTPTAVRRSGLPRQRSPLRRSRPSFFRSSRIQDDYDTWG